jgi:hypothetical protein
MLISATKSREMNQSLQSLRTDVTELAEVPAPPPSPSPVGVGLVPAQIGLGLPLRREGWGESG